MGGLRIPALLKGSSSASYEITVERPAQGAYCKLGVVVGICSPSTGRMEAEELEAQSHSWEEEDREEDK